MMIKCIALIIGTLFEVYSTNLYIGSFLTRKNIERYKLIALYFIILLFQVLASVSCKGVILLICSFITALSLCQLFNSKQYVKIILSITAIVVNIASEMVASGLIMLSEKVDFEKVEADPYLFAMGTLISKFIMYILVLIVCIRKAKLNIENIEFKNLVILSVLPITTVSMILIMYQVMFMVSNTKLKLMFVISSAFVIISNVLTFYIINRQNKLSKAEYELKLLKGSVEEQSKHYILLQESHEEIRQMRHNMRSMCIAILAELKAGNIDNAIKQLNSNVNAIEKTSRVIDTGHPAIDSIIESKLDKCNILGIDTKISYQYKEPINVNEIEIAIVLGNIFDNAIEACEKIENPNKKIWGTITADKQNIIICIKNNLGDFVNFETSKRNKKNHGFGLKSISHIAQKYNGYARFDCDKNIFTSYVVLEN